MLIQYSLVSIDKQKVSNRWRIKLLLNLRMLLWKSLRRIYLLLVCLPHNVFSVWNISTRSSVEGFYLIGNLSSSNRPILNDADDDLEYWSRLGLSLVFK